MQGDSMKQRLILITSLLIKNIFFIALTALIGFTFTCKTFSAAKFGEPSKGDDNPPRSNASVCQWKKFNDDEIAYVTCLKARYKETSLRTMVLPELRPVYPIGEKCIFLPKGIFYFKKKSAQHHTLFFLHTKVSLDNAGFIYDFTTRQFINTSTQKTYDEMLKEWKLEHAQCSDSEISSWLESQNKEYAQTFAKGVAEDTQRAAINEPWWKRAFCCRSCCKSCCGDKAS